MKKINILRIVLIILLLAILFKIFDFSSQDGEKSSNLSRQITETVTKNVKSIQKLEKDRKEIVLSKIEHIIRKMAHFSLYMVVGILLMSLFSTYKMKQSKRFIVSSIISFIYAMSDEFHQMFSPGRTPQFTDVMIDTFGAITGMVIVFLIIKKIKDKLWTV